MPRRLARSRWVGLLVAGVVLLAWAWLLRNQLAAIQTYSWQIKPAAYVVAAVLGAAYFVGLALCWSLLLQRLAGKATAVSTRSAVRVWLFSMMTRYIPGNVWHVLSRVAMAPRLGVTRSVVLSSATIEQVLTLLSAFACFGLSLPFWTALPQTQAPFLLVIPVGLVLLHPRLMGRALHWASVRLRRPELAWDYAYADVLLLLVAYCICWVCAGLALVGLLWGLGALEVAHIPQIVGATALAWAVGYLSLLTPSGLGVREAALVTVLSTMCPLPIAIVASLLHRIMLTLAEVLTLLVVRASENYFHTGGRRDGRTKA